MLSYLITDGPSISVGGGVRGNTSTAVSILLGTISSFASSAASQYAGGLVDYVQLLTTAEGARFGPSFGFGSAFEGAQLGVGQQLSDRMFFSATTGLYQVGQLFQSASARAPSILSSLGAKFEYRFGRGAGNGISGSYEPPFDNLVCSGVADRGFTASKRQVGIDLFRIWRR